MSLPLFPFPSFSSTPRPPSTTSTNHTTHQGTLSTPSGPCRVVLKRMKPAVDGAAGFFEAEHLLNAYASRAAPGAVATFLGFTTVPTGSTGGTAGFATYSRLVEGATYLVWEYEGFKTLSYYLRRRDCDAALAADLGVPLEKVAATVMGDILRAAAQLHRAGIVHRDVKPENLILAEPALYAFGEENGKVASSSSSSGSSSSTTSERPKTSRQRQQLAPRFKLIDLGAAAELRKGTGYDPDVGVLDPRYSPPERFILPTTAPALSSLGAARVPGVSALLGSVLWGRHRPDTFDSYSAGVILMQLAVPKLRSANGLRAFNEALSKRGHDLLSLRDEPDRAVGSLNSDVLDARDGAGWDLAASLLRARARVTDDGEGNVEFGETGGGGRPGADRALRHPFVAAGAVPLADRAPGLNVVSSGSMTTTKVVPAAEKNKSAASAAAATTSSKTSSSSSASSSSAGVLSGAVSSVWRSATRRLFDLEASLVAQSDVVSTQTTRVQLARAKAEEEEEKAAVGSDNRRAAAAAARAELAREEEQLASATKKLRSLASDFERTAKRASDTLTGFWGGSGGSSSSSTSSSSSSAVAVKVTKNSSSAAAKNRTAAALAADVSAAAEEQEMSSSSSVSSPVGSTIKAAAVGSVYSGLKYMGVALKVASALASSVAASAEEATAEAEAAAAAASNLQKTKIVPEVERSAGLAFVDALRELDPPPAENADWDTEVAPRLIGDGRFRAVPAAAARGLYEAYNQALADAAERRAEDARRGFENLLNEEARNYLKAAGSSSSSLPLTSLTWEAAATKWAAEPRFIAAVATGVDVRGLFDSKRGEATKEAAFVTLLSTSIPRVLGSAPAGSRRRLAANLRWSDLRRLISDDDAFLPIAELRRRELFAEQQAALVEAERAAAAAEEAAAAEKRRVLEEEARAKAKAIAALEAAEAAEAKAEAEAGAALIAAAQAEKEAEEPESEEEEVEEEVEEEQPVSLRAASAAAVGDFASRSFDDEDDDDGYGIEDDRSESSSNVEALREEQAKLKAEYERMEEKLRAMEEALASTSE